ncbi:response regulator [Alginatibacterium sediminis]|uniref:Response regulator n=1 Tax=Alginatibacterium sediminis TaxID=2164068 RepID=A0A420EE18_9ALTE|nr:response regulator [Alginatibacterium sediminis]
MQKVLIVDDSPSNQAILEASLQDSYDLKQAYNGLEGLNLAAQWLPQLILLDILMPGIDGFEVCRQLKRNPLTSAIPVIFVTSRMDVNDERKGLEIGAVDYITKPINPFLVQSRVKTHLALYDQQRELGRQVSEMTAELKASRMELIKCLGRASEYNDFDTGQHAERMSRFSGLIAKAMGLEMRYCDLLQAAAPMHDLGKIGINDAILCKPGKLDSEEWELMKKHPEFGEQILGKPQSELLKMASSIAASHHEKWDGSGYPRKLKQDQIPLCGRIVAVADVFDALTCIRPYKDSWSFEAAADYIKSNAGTQFDPQVVRAFSSCLDDIKQVQHLYQ